MARAYLNPAALAHHLRVAANQYDRDAQAARDAFPLPEQQESARRLARCFEDQSAQAREWACALDHIDNDIRLTYTP